MSGIEIKSVTTKLIARKDLKKTSASHKGERFSVDTSENHSNVQVSSTFGSQSIDPLFSNLFHDGSSHAASQKAEEILEQLEEIRLALIQGRFVPSVIEGLANSIRNISHQNDEKLQFIINEIETRALVELAKLEKIKAPQG